MINYLTYVINKKLGIDANFFIRGGFWLSVTQFATLVSGLITTALFAHFLSQTEFGVYKYLIGLAAILASFSLTGLGAAILQATAQQYNNFFRETFKLNFLYSLIISLISFSLSTYYWINHNKILSLGCLLIAVLQPIINTFQFTPSFLQGLHKFKESTTLQAIRIFIVTFLSVGALFLTKNILFLFFVYLFSYAVTNVIGVAVYSLKSTPTPTEIKKRFLAYAHHSSARNLIAVMAQRTDSIIVFTQLGAAELATYSIAMVVPEQIKGSFKNLAALLLQKYSKHASPNIIKHGLYKRSVQLLSLFLLITFFYVLAAPYLFELIFPKYLNAVTYSQILALSFPAMVALLPNSFLQARLSERKLYKLLVIESVITLIMILSFTIYYGILGTIIARVITRYVMMVFNFYYVYK